MRRKRVVSAPSFPRSHPYELFCQRLPSLVNADVFMNANDSDVSVCVLQDKHAEEVRKNKELKEEACR